MSQIRATPLQGGIVYPDSDGKPMADNTKQLRWMVVLFGNLSALFRLRADVFVGADLLWYVVEGQVELRQAPDVLVVFGRPKGDRGSYRQWEEQNVPLTVVFEILSPGNTWTESIDKQTFYEEYGVEEYYVFDPDNKRLQIYLRQGEELRRVRKVHQFISPRLGIRFDLSGPEMVVFGPGDQRFLTFEELEAEREEEHRLRLIAEEQALLAQQQADQARQQADQARQQAQTAQQFAARLAELSRKARRQQATAEEIQELDRLEESSPSS